jgi:NHLM bacteriocin system ABC transporter peptidase/ATP-binding protein
MKKNGLSQQKLRGNCSVPVILQMEAVECGAASLAMVLAYYGCWVSLEELREECGVCRDGSKASGIVKAARKYGLEAKGFREQIETLGRHRLPMIIFWNFNHFVVLTGKKGKNYLLNDPGVGYREVGEEEFDSSFTGVVLSFQPGENLEKRPRRDSMLKALSRRLKGSGFAIFFAVLTGLLLVIPTLLVPTFQRVFIDNILLQSYLHWLNPLFSFMAVGLFLLVSLNWLQLYALLKTNLKLSLVSSANFFQHIFQLPVLFFQQRSSGDLQSRVSLNDEISVMLSDGLAANFLNLIMIGFYGFVMFSYDRVLALVSLVIAVLNFMALKYANQRRFLLSQSLQQDEGKLMGCSMSGLQLIETIKATGGESGFFSTWAGHYARFFNGRQSFGLNTVLLNSVPEALSLFNSVIILVVGSLRIINGDMSIGALLAYQTVVGLFLAPVIGLLNMGSELQEIEVGLARLDDIHKYPVDRDFLPDREKRVTEEEPERLQGELKLEDICFGYNKTAEPLIRNFNLELKPGQRVALVGGSGSGKSTIAKLISGLYQPWSGRILFDGKERHEWSRELLNTSFASVDQEIFLFEGTIAENISMWDSGVPMQDISQATRAACIYDEIASRPGGQGGPVQEGGRNFSGGQRQRLEIARALLKKPSLLILDEATSALDPATEKKIDESVRKLGCTCIIVAHRLSTIRDCDEILLLENGCVAERGNHEELMRLKGAYYKLIAAGETDE